MQTTAPRFDWTREEVRSIYNTRLLDALFLAQTVHRQFFDPGEVQLCQLLSIKTGGCPEDCAYCPQSAHYETGVKAEKLMSLDAVLTQARAARQQIENQKRTIPEGSAEWEILYRKYYEEEMRNLIE